MKNRLFSLFSPACLVALLAVSGSAQASGTNASFIFHVGMPQAHFHSGPTHYRHAPAVVVHHRAPPNHPPHARRGQSHVWVPGHWAPVRQGPDAGRYRRPHGKPSETRAPMPSYPARYRPHDSRRNDYRPYSSR